MTDYSMTNVLKEPGDFLGVVTSWSLNGQSEVVGDSGFLKFSFIYAGQS